jgi:hypothetical protein
MQMERKRLGILAAHGQLSQYYLQVGGKVKQDCIEHVQEPERARLMEHCCRLTLSGMDLIQ